MVRRKCKGLEQLEKENYSRQLANPGLPGEVCVCVFLCGVVTAADPVQSNHKGSIVSACSVAAGVLHDTW